MACLEHFCRDCRHEWSDNDPSRVCPRCRSTNSCRHFDELPEPPERFTWRDFTDHQQCDADAP